MAKRLADFPLWTVSGGGRLTECRSRGVTLITWSFPMRVQGTCNNRTCVRRWLATWLTRFASSNRWRMWSQAGRLMPSDSCVNAANRHRHAPPAASIAAQPRPMAARRVIDQVASAGSLAVVKPVPGLGASHVGPTGRCCHGNSGGRPCRVVHDGRGCQVQHPEPEPESIRGGWMTYEHIRLERVEGGIAAGSSGDVRS